MSTRRGLAKAGHGEAGRGAKKKRSRTCVRERENDPERQLPAPRAQVHKCYITRLATTNHDPRALNLAKCPFLQTARCSIYWSSCRFIYNTGAFGRFRPLVPCPFCSKAGVHPIPRGRAHCLASIPPFDPSMHAPVFFFYPISVVRLDP